MLLLPFLEACIGAFDLWPSYILEILFMRASTPQNLRTLAAFFYGHDVPLNVAAWVYTLCNPYAASVHFIAYVLGSYYSTFYHNTIVRHMAQYYDVSQGTLLWINGHDHFQLEPVLPADRAPFDCGTLRRSSIPLSLFNVVYSTMQAICNEAAFDILEL